MMKTPLKVLATIAFASCIVAGCQTRSRNIVYGQDTQDTSAFAQKDIDYVINQALQSLFRLDRIAVPAGASRAIIQVDRIKNDTSSYGSQADRLELEITQLLKEGLGESGKVILYNPEVRQYASVQVAPQFLLAGRLTQRNARLDNGDYYKEFALNLQLIEIATGLEYWQKRIPFSKEVDHDRLMY